MRKGEAVPEQTFWVYEMDMEELAVRKNIRDQRADERDEAAQLFTWCTVIALNQKEGIGASRLNRACNEMTEFQNRIGVRSTLEALLRQRKQCARTWWVFVTSEFGSRN